MAGSRRGKKGERRRIYRILWTAHDMRELNKTKLEEFGNEINNLASEGWRAVSSNFLYFRLRDGEYFGIYALMEKEVMMGASR